MEALLQEFRTWLARRVDDAEWPVHRRCVEWIVHCAGRADFDDRDLAEAVRQAGTDASAARQVDSIRTAGSWWLKWRKAPFVLPPMAEEETSEGLLSKRYTLTIVVQVDGAVPIEHCIQAVERRGAAWRRERGARVAELLVCFQTRSNLVATLAAQIEPLLDTRWAHLMPMRVSVVDGI